MGVCVGSMSFLDTNCNMLVSAMRNACVGGHAQLEVQTRMGLSSIATVGTVPFTLVLGMHTPAKGAKYSI